MDSGAETGKTGKSGSPARGASRAGARGGAKKLGATARPAPDLSPAAEANAPLSVKAKELMEGCFQRYAPLLEKAALLAFTSAEAALQSVSKHHDPRADEYSSNLHAITTRFSVSITEYFRAWLAGKRRSKHRPDPNASSGLSFLTDDDYVLQQSLMAAVQYLGQTTRESGRPLDARVALITETDDSRKFENPFSTDYLLDAIGVSVRTYCPNPRTYRPVMEHVVRALAGEVSKRYIALNRYLSNEGVLPEAEANMRARSELRPADDRELLGLFNRLLVAPGMPESLPRALSDSIEVPADLGGPPVPGQGAAGFSGAPGGAGARGFANSPRLASALNQPAPDMVQALSTMFAQISKLVTLMPAVPGQVPPPSATGFGLPAFAGVAGQPAPIAAPGAWRPHGLDPSGGTVPGSSHPTTGGTSTPELAPYPYVDVAWPTAMIAALDKYQYFESTGAIHWPDFAAPTASGTPAVVNRMPLIRAAVADQLQAPIEGVTMDVIALLFDYIFRDPSIPDAMHTMFAKLQVPIAKAALLDAQFFSNKKHPARLLLDSLAAATIGAGNNQEYMDALQKVAGEIVANVCRDFQTDVAIFEVANAHLCEHIEADRQAMAEARVADVAAALEFERVNTHLVTVREIVAEKTAGLELPFEVRSFVDTIWVEHLRNLHEREGPEGEKWKRAVVTLEELLWSVSSPDRSDLRGYLRSLIPNVVRELKGGCTEVGVDETRTAAFFESIFNEHMRVLKPHLQFAASNKPTVAVVAANDEAAPLIATKREFKPIDVHEFVNEITVGTWLVFKREGEKFVAKLFWISPKRMKFVFTTRTRALAFILTPDELIFDLAYDRAGLLVEPVPMYDRAINWALDALSANQQFTAQETTVTTLTLKNDAREPQ